MSLLHPSSTFLKKSTFRSVFGSGLMAGLSVSVLCIFILNFIPFQASAFNDTIFNDKQIASIKKNLEDTTRSPASLSSEYHSTVNAIMNGYMKAMLEKTSIITPPQNDPDCLPIGSTMNVSTYCLFVRLDDLYQTYTSSLKILKNSSLQRINDILNNRQDASANYYISQGEWIDREMTSTQKALDSGLQAYSELLLQYPMHREYQTTISDLVKYYDHLVDLRKNVDTFPARFQNVTTAQCE